MVAVRREIDHFMRNWLTDFGAWLIREEDNEELQPSSFFACEDFGLAIRLSIQTTSSMSVADFLLVYGEGNIRAV